MTKITPIGDRIVVKPIEKEETTKSGIVLPTSAKEKPQEGEVIAVGSGKIVDGKKIPLEIKVGDKVVYERYASSVTIKDEDYVIIREDEVLAIIEK